MAEKTYNQVFDGYWRYVNRGNMPEKSGIYCVYAGTYNQDAKTVSLNRLLYIGQASNIHDRLQDHECYPKWNAKLKNNEIIIFSCTLLGESDLDRFEAAMIYKHKPPVNDLCVNYFRHDTTNVNLSGKIALLVPKFTVYRSEY